MSKTNDLAPLWKFAEVSPTSPEFAKLTCNDEVTFIPLEDVWPTHTAENFQTVDWETRLTGYTPFRRGDLLLPKVTPTVTHGRTMIADITTNLGVASTEVYTVRPRPSTDPRWLAYALVETEFLELAGASVQGTGGLKRISTQFVESYPLPNAATDEQRAIADYLDRETAEIDGMRADLDEMERLLTERRVSIVQRHVLPKDGTYTRIKLVAEVTLGKTVQKTQTDSSEVLRNYVRAAHIQPHGRLTLDDQPMWFTPNELKQLTLEAGDVLVVEGGAGYGRSTYLHEDLPEWGFQNHVIRVRPLGGASGRFIDYTIRAHYGAGLIDILADGATIPGLSSDKARELPILNISNV